MQGFLDEDMGPVELIGIPTFFVTDQTQMSRQAASPRSILIIFSWAETENSELLNFGLISWDLRCDVISRMPYGHQISTVLT
jgi:hypothetical protein